MDIKKLIAVATGEIDHTGDGLCPDRIEGFDSRDPDCPACKILTKAAAEHDAMVRRLREAEARVAELEAERAEQKAGKVMAYLSNDKTKFFVPSMEGKDVKHALYMAHWMAGWTPLYAAPRATAPVRLTDEQADTIWREIQDTSITSPEYPHRRFKDKIEAASLCANGFDIQPPKNED